MSVVNAVRMEVDPYVEQRSLCQQESSTWRSFTETSIYSNQSALPEMGRITKEEVVAGQEFQMASSWRAAAPLRPNPGLGPLNLCQFLLTSAGGPAALLFTASRHRAVPGVASTGAAAAARP